MTNPERTGLVRSMRAVGALGVLALTGGVVAGAAWLPAPERASALPLAVAVPPTQVALVCPGPVAARTPGVSDSELGGASEVVGEAIASVLSRDGLLGPATFGGLVEPGTTLTAGEAGSTTTLASPSGATVLRAEPEGTAAFATAAVAYRADAGDVRGLSATPCPAPASTLWFAAGRTEVGDSAVLTLRNSGSTPATVTLRAWGALGAIALTAPPVVVAPGAEVEQVLEAVVPQQDRLVVEVTSSGGQVGATLETQQLRGLTPAGTDLVMPTEGPATALVVPGVVIGTSTIDDADPSLVRVLNPGAEPVTVTLDLLGPEGPVGLGGTDALVVESGAVADVTLGGAPAGTYAVRVLADSPVVVGVSLVRPGLPAPEDPDVPVADRAWLVAAAPSTSAAVAVPGLGTVADRGVLVVADARAEADVDSAEADSADADAADADAADAAEDATEAGGTGRAIVVRVTAYDATGAELGTRQLHVPAAGSLAVDLRELAAGTTTLRIDADAPVGSAVVLTRDDALGELISVLAAQPDPQVERSAAIRVSLS